MILISENDCTRLYLPRSRVAHLATPDSGHYALCRRVAPRWPEEWLGTGSQAEYEKAAKMRTCTRCRDVLHAHPPLLAGAA